MEPIDELEQDGSQPEDQVGVLVEARPVDGGSLKKPEYNVSEGPGFDTYKEQYAYLRFVLNPDIEQPVRMPSQISYPTALVQYNQNFTLTMAQGDFGAQFAPQNTLLNYSSGSERDYRFVTRITSGAPTYGGSSWGHLS